MWQIFIPIIIVFALFVAFVISDITFKNNNKPKATSEDKNDNNSKIKLGEVNKSKSKVSVDPKILSALKECKSRPDFTDILLKAEKSNPNNDKSKKSSNAIKSSLNAEEENAKFNAIEKEILENKDIKTNPRLREEIKNLSPQMKAMLFGDVLNNK